MRSIRGDGDEIDEAARHRDIGDIRRPDLIGPLDLHAAQQIGINLVARRGFRGVAAPIDRLDPHAPHQRCHVSAADGDAFALEKIAQHARAREGAFQMQFVDATH